MSSTANHHAKRISDAAEKLAGAVRDAVKELPEEFRGLNQDLGQRAAQGFDAVGAAGRQAWHQGRDSLGRVEQDVESRVRAQPWQALLVAFGVGALVGLLARSRS